MTRAGLKPRWRVRLRYTREGWFFIYNRRFLIGPYRTAFAAAWVPDDLEVAV
jgi:hypothetical protein